MVENSEKMRQATAYLNVKKEKNYDNDVITEKEYYVSSNAKRVRHIRSLILSLILSHIPSHIRSYIPSHMYSVFHF